MSRDILSIIKSINADEVTDRELSEFELLIEESIKKVSKLQQIHRSMTGKEYVPPLRSR